MNRIGQIVLVLVLLLPLVLGCRHQLPSQLGLCLNDFSAGHRQAVVVSPVPHAAPRVKVALFEKGDSGWKELETFDGVAGVNGFAPPGEKREGDGRTPSGIFGLRRGFGYGPLETKIDYIVLTPEMIWVDDPKSSDYNRLVSLEKVKPHSYETMRRADDLYKYGTVVEYNTDPIVPGMGSAIFFHIYRGPEIPTAGCVAVAEEKMVRILRWLDPAKSPVAFLGTDMFCGGNAHRDR